MLIKTVIPSTCTCRSFGNLSKFPGNQTANFQAAILYRWCPNTITEGSQVHSCAANLSPTHPAYLKSLLLHLNFPQFWYQLYTVPELLGALPSPSEGIIFYYSTGIKTGRKKCFKWHRQNLPPPSLSNPVIILNYSGTPKSGHSEIRTPH